MHIYTHAREQHASLMSLEALDSWELELETVVSYHVVVGNGALIFYRSTMLLLLVAD